jgi:hypothetical protein
MCADRGSRAGCRAGNAGGRTPPSSRGEDIPRLAGEGITTAWRGLGWTAPGPDGASRVPVSPDARKRPEWTVAWDKLGQPSARAAAGWCCAGAWFWPSTGNGGVVRASPGSEAVVRQREIGLGMCRREDLARWEPARPFARPNASAVGRPSVVGAIFRFCQGNLPAGRPKPPPGARGNDVPRPSGATALGFVEIQCCRSAGMRCRNTQDGRGSISVSNPGIYPREAEPEAARRRRDAVL